MWTATYDDIIVQEETWLQVQEASLRMINCYSPSFKYPFVFTRPALPKIPEFRWDCLEFFNWCDEHTIGNSVHQLKHFYTEVKDDTDDATLSSRNFREIRLNHMEELYRDFKESLDQNSVGNILARLDYKTLNNNLET